MIALSPISCLLLVIGGLILSGKGDFLIAGYNTAKAEEKQKTNVKRLRALVGGISFLSAVLLWIPILLGKADDIKTQLAISLIIMAACIIVVVLANTWARKK